MASQRKAILLGLLTVLLWSTVASAFKLSLRYITPVQLLFYASPMSILVLSVILLFREGRINHLWQYSRHQYLQSLGLGLMNPCLYYLVLFGAYDRLPAQEAQPLNYTWALTLTYLSVPLLGHRLKAAGYDCRADLLQRRVCHRHPGAAGEFRVLRWLGGVPGTGEHSDLGPVLDCQHAGYPGAHSRPVTQFPVRPPRHRADLWP